MFARVPKPHTLTLNLCSQIVEYGLDYYGVGDISRVTGTAQTRDGSDWAAVVDVDSSVARVYNNVRAEYVAVTTKGTVTAFQVRFGIQRPGKL